MTAEFDYTARENRGLVNPLTPIMFKDSLHMRGPREWTRTDICNLMYVRQ